METTKLTGTAADSRAPGRHSRPTIFYIGDLSEGGTCRDRMGVLSRLGCPIVPFDLAPYLFSNPRLARSIAHRANIGLRVRLLNAAVTERVCQTPVLEVIWVDKGKWIYPGTLAAIKQLTGVTLVHYTPDPQLVYHRSRHFEASLSLYDYVFTTKRYELPLYRKLGARNVFLTNQLCDADRFCPQALTDDDIRQLSADVCFIGHFEKSYARLLRVVADLGVHLKVWGPGWTRYARVHRWARPHVQGEGLWGESYPKALQASKICLGLLSKLAPDATTTRTFEIPACGAFLLAERTKEHRRLFAEGVEAEYFTSPDELGAKVRFYLARPQERERIARAGRRRFLDSGLCMKQGLSAALERISA